LLQHVTVYINHHQGFLDFRLSPLCYKQLALLYPIYYADDDMFRPMWDHLHVTKI